MKDRYFFKINTTLRGNQDHIMVDCAYEKGRGYIATVQPAERRIGSFAVKYDSHYWGKYKPMEFVIFSCTRNTAKAKAMAEARFTEATARQLAREFCCTLMQRCGESVGLLAEAAA